MKKLNLTIMTLTSIGVLSLCLQPSLATSISEWKPNLSEKILLLPPQHLEQAINQDFSKSLLAQDLIDVDTQHGISLFSLNGELEKMTEGKPVKVQRAQSPCAYTSIPGTC